MSNKEPHRDIVRREPIKDVTRCGWQIGNASWCTIVHGTLRPSQDGRTSVVNQITWATIKDGVPVPLCDLCKIRADIKGWETMPYGEAYRRVEQSMLAEGAADAPAPMQAPASAPQAAPAISVTTTAKTPTSTPEPRPQQRPQQAHVQHPRSYQAHVIMLQKMRNGTFEDAFFPKKGNACSCGACDRQSGSGFVTKDGDHKGQRYPLCGMAVSAVDHLIRSTRDEGRRAFLIFRDQKHWQRFDEKDRRRTETDALRGQAVLAGELTQRNGCALTACNAKKATDRLVRFVDGKVVEYWICYNCSRAAAKLRDQLREDGTPWGFHLLREGQTLSPKQMRGLQHATRQIAQDERDRERAAARGGARSGSKPKIVARGGSGPRSVGHGTLGEQMKHLVDAARNAAAASASTKMEPKLDAPAPDLGAAVALEATAAPTPAPEPPAEDP